MVRVGSCVIAVLASGCLESGLVPCGDKLCPAGMNCVADAVCASDEQVQACVSVADGAPCLVAAGAGTCDRGACVLAGCGNGVPEAGEACDDGNQTSGDGCRADCRKVEQCGDGIVDDGEACDDANANAADGCDACTPTTWRATAVIGGMTNATMIGLEYPGGVATDRAGNIYIADTWNHRIRRMDATLGVITTVAGTGVEGFSGDGGAATGAMLAFPEGVAVDGLGNLYVIDASRIRRVDATTGIITTLAGSDQQGAAGDGGPALSALLSYPRDVTVDGLGNVYIADGTNRIRRVDAASGIITTVAGTGTAGFSGDGSAATAAQLDRPEGVAVDNLGNLYIADSTNQRVRRVDAISGVITTVAGSGVVGTAGDGGPALDAQLYGPRDVTLDALGALYIADNGSRVRRVDPTTGIITTIAGMEMYGFSGDGGDATDAQLNNPSGLAVDGGGTLYIADTHNHRVRRVDTGGVISTAAGAAGALDYSADGGAATSAQLGRTRHVASDGLGNLYFSDEDNHRVRRVDAVTGIITTVAGTGVAGYSGDGGAGTSAQLAGPRGLAIDGQGNLYIADGNNCIRRVDAATGIITTVAGTGTYGVSGDGGPATSAQLAGPTGLAVDGVGNLYIAGNYTVRRVDVATGIIATVAGTGTQGYSGDGGAATSAALHTIRYVAVDAIGTIYIPDERRIRRVDPVTGVITTVAGTGSQGFSGDGGPATSATLWSPAGVGLDDLGNLYIADNDRVRRVDAVTGIITKVAGSGPGGSLSGGFWGDGGPALDARFNNPAGVAVDDAGDLYVTDFNNYCIRRVDAATGIITTIAGAIDPDGMGPLAQARLADPRALVVAPAFTLIAGGTSGTVQAIRATAVEVVAGRYPHSQATGALARFRDQSFGAVGGVAFDAEAGLVFVAESSAHRLHVVSAIDPAREDTWTIAPLANAASTPGFADGAAATAKFRTPTGLHYDAATKTLYVADAGNHAIRAIDLSAGVASATVRTIAGTPETRGFFGDAGAATTALLYQPQALTRCANGDLFVADTGNHRVRRIAASTGVITTVLGVGVAASSGEGGPASTFPVDAPLGLACDASGNLLVSSTATVRLLPADAAGVVDGTGPVQTIYGVPPRDAFPERVTRCLTGLQVTSTTTALVADSCAGMVIELRREPL